MVLGWALVGMPAIAPAQADSGFPEDHPAGATCAGDAAHLDRSEAASAAVADPARGMASVEWEVESIHRIDAHPEGGATRAIRDPRTMSARRQR